MSLPPNYQFMMARLGCGTAQWHPTLSSPKGITIGDVGFMDKGQFFKLFTATHSVEEFDDGGPNGFTPLEASGIKSVIREPYPLHTHSVSVSGADVGTVPSTPIAVAPGMSVSFQLSQNEGAGFLTTQDTICTDTCQNGLLKTYIKEHHSSWVNYARAHGYEDIDLILVSGIDTAGDFAMFAYATTEGAEFSATLKADIPSVTPARANIWTSGSYSGPVHLNWADPENPALDTYVTFFRGWRLRRRFPTVKADAGPHDSEYGIVSDTPEEVTLFDPVFKYVFEKCTAEAALLHDDDLISIFEMASHPTDTIEAILTKYPPSIEVDSRTDVATLRKEENKKPHDAKATVNAERF